MPSNMGNVYMIYCPTVAFDLPTQGVTLQDIIATLNEYIIVSYSYRIV